MHPHIHVSNCAHTHTVCRDTIDLITTHSYGLCLLSLATCSCWVRVSSRTPRRPGCFEINSPPAGPTFLIAHTLSRLNSFYLLFGLTSVVVLSFSLSLIFLFLFSPSLNYILFTIFLPSPPPSLPPPWSSFPPRVSASRRRLWRTDSQTITFFHKSTFDYLADLECTAGELCFVSQIQLLTLTHTVTHAHTHTQQTSFVWANLKCIFFLTALLWWTQQVCLWLSPAPIDVSHADKQTKWWWQVGIW